MYAVVACGESSSPYEKYPAYFSNELQRSLSARVEPENCLVDSTGNPTKGAARGLLENAVLLLAYNVCTSYAWAFGMRRAEMWQERAQAFHASDEGERPMRAEHIRCRLWHMRERGHGMDDTERIEAEATDVASEATSKSETKDETQHDQSSGGVLAAAASFVDAVTNAGGDQPEGLDDGVLDLLGLERLDDDEDTAGGLAAVTVVPVVAETVAEPGEEAPVRKVTLRRRLDVIKSEGADVRTEARVASRRGIIGEPAVIRRLNQRTKFDEITSNGTIAAAVMVVAALLAVTVANSPIYEHVLEILEAPITVGVAEFSLSISIEAFINDFLMAVFFLLVGIELKYEMTVGQLRRPRQAALPMLAAVGGVAVPALIYLLLNFSGGDVHGWAVPIATDIAFALGVMSLLGDRVTPETKVFFQTLAIADDLLAIVVLALFYGQTPKISWCAAALVVIMVLWALNRAHVYSSKPYILVGLVLWVCMYNSGIHATLAGVILAFFLPARSDVRLSHLRSWLAGKARALDDRYDDKTHVLGQHDFTEAAVQVEKVMHHVTPPLERVERYISVTVNFLILPLFAFANAQVRFVGADFGAVVTNPVTQGVFFGAVAGKPLGIILVTWVLVKIGFAKLPNRVTWDQVIAVGIMGGMGFTMSILISGLAYTDSFDVMSAKCAILAASVAAALLGIGFVQGFHAITGKREDDPEDEVVPEAA